MDQVTSSLRNETPPDHGMARLHCCELPFALQCNPKLLDVEKNQGHHFHLSLDNETFHFDRGRQGEVRLEDCQIVLHHGHEGRINFKIRCPIAITDR